MTTITLAQAMSIAPDWVDQIRAEWGADVLSRAVEHHSKRALRANIRTGQTLDRDGWRKGPYEGYTPETYASRPDWVFFDFMAGDVSNSCSRLARGLAP